MYRQTMILPIDDDKKSMMKSTVKIFDNILSITKYLYSIYIQNIVGFHVYIGENAVPRIKIYIYMI